MRLRGGKLARIKGPALARGLALALAGVAMLGAMAILLVATHDFGALDAESPTPAEARAIGARWRLVKSDEMAMRYAQALIAAGLNDDLLNEIRDGGLLAADESVRAVFTAEAMLRQRRYDDAIKAADGAAPNPQLSYIRARAHYALTADADATLADLQRALRGPDALAAEAWLFRARLALDVNDSETAMAASRRARDAGAVAARVEAIEIESLIRQGDLASAAKIIEERSRRNKSGDDDGRLAAMISLRLGEARAAARRLDAMAGDDGRTALLAILAKQRAGDIAQAHAMIERELRLAPQNWMALDLASAISNAMDRDEEAELLLDRLSHERPSLVLLRRMRLPSDPDEAYDALIRPSDASGIAGVGAALLGEGADLPEGLREAAPNERALIALGAGLAADNVAGINPNDAIAGRANDPVALTLGGAAYEALNEWAKADETYVRASVVAPDFFKPVKRAADLARRRGANVRAVALLQNFAAAHPDHIEAKLELARAYAEANDFRSAAKTYAQIEPEIMFSSLETASAYAEAAINAGHEARAAMLAAAARAADMKILGETLFIAGDDEGAAAALRKALIADPADADAARHYAEAMTRLGRAEEAGSLIAAIEKRADIGAPVEESGAPEPENAQNRVKNEP